MAQPVRSGPQRGKGAQHLLGPVLDAPIYDGPRAQTTLQRWHQVHDLLDQGVGLLESARRL